MKINAIIIIPEITKGMKSIGSKSLLKLKNSSIILEHQIQQLKLINRNIQITIATGFDKENIDKVLGQKKYSKIKVSHNEEFENTNQGKSLNLYLENNTINDNLLIINSGIIFNRPSITSSTLKNNSKIYLLDKPKNNFDIGCNNTSKTEYLFYDLPQAWSECVFLNKQAIDTIKDYNKKRNLDQMYIFEIVNILMENGIIFDKVYLPKKTIMKVSSIKDLTKTKTFI
jgi:hypothetical protein